MLIDLIKFKALIAEKAEKPIYIAAEEMGVTRATICRILRGYTNVNAKTLNKICAYYQIKTIDLLQQ